ncbi:MAG: UvrD-helicase domain-containing protein, partial [Kofleriaceae bacterium]
RASYLLRALGGIDTAHIATVHGFADRLLRKWPAEARLDPMYELEEDTAALVEQCFEMLVQAAETRTLGELLQGSALADRGEEATSTILDLQRAGIRMRSLETEHWTYHGLDSLIADYVRHRDIELADPPVLELDRNAFHRFAAEFLRLTDGLSTETTGGNWLLETASVLRAVRDEADTTEVFRQVVERLERGPRGRASDRPRRNHDFAGDKRAWEVWKALDGDERREAARPGSLRDDLLAPLRGWLAIRVARLRPVVLHVYELVKARRQVVDQMDLLLRLRNLLRDDRRIRRACQGLFDHIFVDEFQDTDPLQAEIVLFLCERGAESASWETVALAPGALTIVGDPKQSIYRFRRADIATYQRVVEVVRRSPHLIVTLSSSYRSAPRLVDWINGQFAGVFEGAGGAVGDVDYQPLTHGRSADVDPTIHAIAMDLHDGGTVAEYRALEAAATARYLRWLVEVSGTTIVDPLANEPRALRYGDIGVLAISTSNLPVLFAAFDHDGVPYAARGGSLFLGDPLHRRFMLGLCALADRDDGVALAALLRPPFFAVDLGDLARADPEDPADRAAGARALIRELRRRRFARSPGATARALLEETGLGRTLALGPNGSQRLAGLQELCFQLEKLAHEERVDFDGAVDRVRGWLTRPTGLDRPHPVDGNTIRVMTVHQAKGLEFPVVVLWDGRAAWTERATFDAWTVERDGRGWALRLDGLRWGEPAGLEIVERERAMRSCERKRLVYVAVTRARDVLVIPEVGPPDTRWILGRLLGTARSTTVLEHPVHTPAAHAPWFDAAIPPVAPPHRRTPRDVELRARWGARAQLASQERMRPIAFTQAAEPRSMWGRVGRFGMAFGGAVHLAIGLALHHRVAVAEAARRGAAGSGLRLHLAEVAEDVSRALAALAWIGISSESAYELEYPVAGLSPGGQLVSGYVDLIAVIDQEMLMIDFKTDAPPEPGQPLMQRYQDQVGGYAGVLQRTLGRPVRAGLLYTADGGVRWLSPDDHRQP